MRALHTCAKPEEAIVSVRYPFGRGQLFAISCPRAAPGFTRHQPDVDEDKAPEHMRRWAYYVARDAQGGGAVKLAFPALRPDGGSATIDTMPAGRPERSRPVDAYDPLQRRPDYDPPRLYNDFASAGGRACRVRALWEIAGQKAQLIYWAEADQCPAGTPPVMKVKLNRLPPGTVLRVNDGVSPQPANRPAR